jgi:hypothetical protein
MQVSTRPIRAYISQIASGGGWSTTLTLFNPTSGQDTVTIAFQADDGSALPLPLIITQGGARQVLTSSEVSRTIQPLATLTIESEAPSTSATLAGWAEVTTVRSFSGSAVFRQRFQDGRTVEAIAPLDSSAPSSVVVPFDNREGSSTGVALVNPADTQVNLIVRSRNENGIQFDQNRMMLPPRGHSAFVIADRFPSSIGQQGTIEFVSPIAERLTGLGLRFSASGGFTSVPVLHLTEPLATQP